MASSVPPSNPFDGFDSYSTVAAPAMTTQPQGAGASVVSTTTQQMPPSQQQQQQQYVLQDYERPVAAVASPFYAGQMLPLPGMRDPRKQQQQPGQQQPPASVQQPIQQGFPQQEQHQLVPAAPSAMSPWALPPAAPPTQMSAPNAFSQQQQPVQQQQQFMSSMDPFAVQQPQQQQQQLVPQPQHQQQLLSPQYQIPQQPMMIPPKQPTAQQRLQNEARQFFNEQQNPPTKPSSAGAVPDATDEEGLGLIDVELDEDENNPSSASNFEHRRADGEFFGRQQTSSSNTTTTNNNAPRDKNADIAPPPPITPARPHAEYLAQQATRNTPFGSSGSSASMSSPLPQPSLVVHSGYVLSRISFRTVLLRKWKQTFWIQYGPTQLLFFRSFADYEDWLNNPYHTQKARDFLIKLRIDFVSDLKKSSVMGYQVTQIRRKPYNKNVMLHFKLERWMDYGPTIAAAFAAREEEMVHSPSHNRNHRRNSGGGGRDDNGGGGEDYMNTTNDVASLRKIILGCMRNARDAALVASRGGGDPQEVYRGRYSTEGEEYNTSSSARGTTAGRGGSGSSSANMGYHQAFSAESTPRRRMNADEVREISSAQESVDTEESAEAPATNGVVDLLG